MLPPVYTLAQASGAVQTRFGNPVRIYPFGHAPQGVTLPYATWQTIGGAPENYLGSLPDADSYTVQVDVYGVSADSVLLAAKALRDVYQPSAYITRWNGESQDPVTKHDRFSFDVDFIVTR